MSAASIVAIELPSKHLTNHAHPYQHKVLTAFHILKQPFTTANMLKSELIQIHWSTCLQTLEGHSMLQKICHLTAVYCCVTLYITSIKLLTQQLLLKGCLASPFTVKAYESPANLYIACWNPEHLLLHALWNDGSS